MRRIRFYCNPLCEGAVELTGTEAHHLANVRRLAEGDKIELFDGAGSLARATIISANSRKVSLQTESIQTVSKPWQGEIVIAVSCPKAGRFDWLITKCTELGVDRIAPVIFERTVKQPKNPKAAIRWRNLSIAAAKQCGRLFLPQIDQPMPLEQAVEKLKADLGDAKLLFGSVLAGTPAIIDTVNPDGDVIAFIGPEGGLTEQEQCMLKEQGCRGVRITDTILRIETAAISFAVILAARRVK